MDAFVFGLTILSQVVPYNALAVTANSTSTLAAAVTSSSSSSPMAVIREQTQASSAPTLEENDSYEVSGQQQNNQSPEKLFAQIDDNIRDKLEGLDSRMSNVNNNMEMLKKKFDLLSVNEHYVNQKLFNFEAGMHDRLEKMDKGLKQKIDNLEKGMRLKLDNLKSGNAPDNSGADVASSDESSVATDEPVLGGTPLETTTTTTTDGIPLAGTSSAANHAVEPDPTRTTTKASLGTERNDIRAEGTTSKTLDTLIKWMNHNMEEKFDQIGKKMNNVNRNVETLKQEFETLSLKEKYVEQKLDTLENGVRQKMSAMEGRVNEKLESVQLGAQKPFTGVERKLDTIETSLGGKLTKKFFLFFNVLLVPTAHLLWKWLKPIGTKTLLMESEMG